MENGTLLLKGWVHCLHGLEMKMVRNNATVPLMIMTFGVTCLSLIVLSDKKETVSKTPTVSIGLREKPRALQDQVDFQKDLEVLDEFKKTQNRDIEKLKEFADQGAMKWMGRDHQRYFDWVLDVCQILTAYDFGSDDRFVLAENYAKRALAQREEMEIGVETGLVVYIMVDINNPNGTLDDGGWPRHRKEKAELWLHALRRLEKSIDEKFDPEDEKNWPLANVMPPGGDGKEILTSGMDPNAIKNPRIRARYKALLEANHKKSEKMTEQVTLRNIRQYFSKTAVKRLTKFYSTKPYNIEELRELLQTYSISPKISSAILKAVESNMGADKGLASK